MAAWIKIHLSYLMLLFVTVLTNVLERPKNEAVISGQEIQLTCSSGSAKIFWFHISPKDGNEETLFDGNEIQFNSFSNTNATGRVPGQILYINPVKLDNSGTFKCVVTKMESSAQLIVLESTPLCGTTINASHQGYVDLWCRVNFIGLWPPRMQWIQGDRMLPSPQQRSSASVSSTLTVKVESFGGNASYICKTSFVAEDNPLKDEDQIAKNVPTFAFTSGLLLTILIKVSYNSATKDATPIAEITAQPSSNNTNAIMWILASCAALACLVVFIVIVCYLRKHPDVCVKSAEPDIVQNAEVIQIGLYPLAENRVDLHPVGLGLACGGEDPDEMHGNACNVDYAEVIVLDRKFPSNMQDSPAWNNAHHGACSKSVQNSPAWSHSNRNLPPSRGATPRNGSPMVNIEDVEYLDINSVATIPVPHAQPPRRPPARLPTFQVVSYASIDHTSRPPPPLPTDDDD